MASVAQPRPEAGAHGAQRQETLNQYVERMALRSAVPAGIVLALAILIANRGRNPVPFSDDWRALGRILVIWIVPLALVTSGIGYVLGTWGWNARVPASRRRSWRVGVIPIAVTYTLLLTAIAGAGVYIVSAAFRQLVLDKYLGAILMGVVGAALLFWMIKQVMIVSVSRLLQTTTTLMAGGIYLAMVRIDDPLWWQQSLSHLGTLESNTHPIFNSTLILAGILFLVWLPYLMMDIALFVEHGLVPARRAQWLQWGFMVIACAIMAVGVFRWGMSPFLSFVHNLAAYTVAGALVLLMLGTRWLVPGLPRELYLTTWILLAGMLVGMGAAAVGYFNTVGLELVSFTLGMTWLQSFVRHVQTRAVELEPEAFPA